MKTWIPQKGLYNKAGNSNPKSVTIKILGSEEKLTVQKLVYDLASEAFSHLCWTKKFFVHIVYYQLMIN